MKTGRTVKFTLVTSMLLALVVVAEANCTLPVSDSARQGVHDQSTGSSLTGIWQGTYANQNDVASKAYLDITEHADGSLSGRWGNDPQGALKIEHGECVTRDIFQWEASSEANEKGRYRVRATLKGNTLQLDITYTWREDGKVNGLTAASVLTRKLLTKSRFQTPNQRTM